MGMDMDIHAGSTWESWFERGMRKESSYVWEVGGLQKYLKGGVDPYDYAPYLLEEFLEQNPEMMPSDKSVEYYEDYGWHEWLDEAPEEHVEAFKEYCEENPLSSRDMHYEAPPYEAMDYTRFVKPTWLVHFTNDAWSIQQDGFAYGHDEMQGLALTTWKSEKGRKKYPGYNFAFEAGSRYAKWAASQKKYGKQAVVFWGGGVQASHSGDEEEQIIIWGPSVNINMIFPMYSDGSEWYVLDDTAREQYRGDFENAVSWIEANYRMLQSIRGHKKKPKSMAGTGHGEGYRPSSLNGNWHGRSMSFAMVSSPLSMSKKEWVERGMDVDWNADLTNDEWTEIFRERHKRADEWSSAMAYEISMGRIDPGKAKSMGFMGPPEKISPLPPVLYHVTTAAPSVLAGGLKARKNLSSPSGLGGGPDDTISFTENREIADDILNSMLEARQVAGNELTVRKMIDMAKSGEGAERPWIGGLESAKKTMVYDSPIEEVVETGKAIARSRSPMTKEVTEFAFFGNHDWNPVDPPDERGRHSVWSRTFTADEIDDMKVSFYKYWASFREMAGGGMYPLFWGDSMVGLASIDVDDIGILRCSMRDGSMGYKVNALGEWRTWTGDTVESMEILSPLGKEGDR